MPPRPSRTKAKAATPRFSIVEDAPIEPDQTTQMLSVFRALGMVLSARALLLLAVACAFVLALIAATHETRETLWVLIAWCACTVAPIVLLELRRRGD